MAAGGGIGAAITVMSAFHRRRHQAQTALVTSLNADRSAVPAEQVAEHNRRDATEPYTKAFEQLGHATAAVRLGGLYSPPRAS